MAVILPFPIRVHHAMTLAWAVHADAALQKYGGWLWAGADGIADIPGHIGDAWRECVVGYIQTAPLWTDPARVDWQQLWLRFVDWHLSAQPEWRRAVAVKLAGFDGVVGLEARQ